MVSRTLAAPTRDADTVRIDFGAGVVLWARGRSLDACAGVHGVNAVGI